MEPPDPDPITIKNNLIDSFIKHANTICACVTGTGRATVSYKQSDIDLTTLNYLIKERSLIFKDFPSWITSFSYNNGKIDAILLTAKKKWPRLKIEDKLRICNKVRQLSNIFRMLRYDSDIANA